MSLIGLFQQLLKEIGGTSRRIIKVPGLARPALGCALALVVMQVATPSSFAATLIYDASLGTLPSAQGWTHFSSGLPESNYSVSSGSLLQGDTLPETNIQSYKSPGIIFDFAHETVSTSIRLQIISSGLNHPPDPTGQGFRRAGWGIQITDSQGRFVTLFVGSTGFFLLGQNSESSGLVDFDTTTAFHDYAVTLNSSGATLTVDGTPMGSLTFAQFRTDGPVNSSNMDIGDLTIAHGSSSRISAFSITVVPGQLLNISSRLRVQTGENVLIGGFIITGTEPKRVIARGIGPSLTGVGVKGALADPVLELHGPGAFVTITNDNWRSDQQAEIEATGIAPTNDFESAIVATLPANNSGYTAIVRGNDNTTGVGVVEAFDLDTAVNSKLGNISTRGLVETGNDVLIAGFIAGNGVTKVIIRAIGPTLSNVGVTNPLLDPTVELFNGSGTSIALNNDWRTTQETEIIATTIPPSDDRESAIVASLVPGSYTAVVRGTSNTTGIAVVEVYKIQ